jgi:hypothetical protein
MSRGLGRLQRFIKEQIYRAEREYKRESVALSGRRRLKPDLDPIEESVKNFVVNWYDVRNWVHYNPDFNPDSNYRLSEALERSAKQALHTLVKRGEIVRLRGGEGRLNQYITKEMDQSLNEGAKAVMEGFARMEAEGNLQAKIEFRGSGPEDLTGPNFGTLTNPAPDVRAPDS